MERSTFGKPLSSNSLALFLFIDIPFLGVAASTKPKSSSPQAYTESPFCQGLITHHNSSEIGPMKVLQTYRESLIVAKSLVLRPDSWWMSVALYGSILHFGIIEGYSCYPSSGYPLGGTSLEYINLLPSYPASPLVHKAYLLRIINFLMI
jgi:hypothetical protein